MLSFPNKITKP